MSSTPTSMLAHDLRGPLVTIEGFQGEIANALDDLEALLSDNNIELPEEAAVRLAGLLSDDLRPCLSFAARAVSSLHERIDGLDSEIGSPEQSSADIRRGVRSE